MAGTPDGTWKTTTSTMESVDSWTSHGRGSGDADVNPATRTRPPLPVRDRRYLAAKTVTEVFAPTVVLGAGFAVVAVGTAPTVPSGLLYAAVAVLLGCLLPFAFVVVGVRRGRFSDHHIRVRGQRHIPLIVGLTCVVTSFALLVALAAPRPLLVLFGLVIAAMLPSMAVTVWWQISVHTAVAALTATALVALWGPWLAVTGGVVAAVGWSRVVLQAHTVAQVWVGAVLGTAIGALAWPLLG